MFTDARFGRPGLSRPARILIAAVAWTLLVCGAAAAAETSQAQDSPEKKDAQAPAAPAPAKEGFTWGAYEGRTETEVGYRWVTTAGSTDAYRSMINLGEGPKLIRSNLSLRANYGAGTVFDHLDASIDNWGGDPYNTARFSFGRTGAYEVRAIYLNQNYYNFLPVFANPFLADGKTFNQHGLDVGYRNTDIELKLFTTHWVRPFFGFARSSGFGPGFTTENFTNNEFLLRQNWRYSANDYRGGLEFALPRVHVTVEQGFRFLKNDTAVEYAGDWAGNNPGSFLGYPQVLTDLDRGYHDRTNVPIFRSAVKATPFNWLKLTGRYIYAMGDTEGIMNEVATGSLVSLEKRLIYRAEADAFNTRAKKPNHNGSFLIEISPFSRLNIIDQFETRTFHVSGTGLLSSTYYQARSLTGGPAVNNEVRIDQTADSYLSYQGVRNQLEAEVGILGGLYARGGYRATSTEASVRSVNRGRPRLQSANVFQNTGIAGFVYRKGSWLNLGMDLEKNQADDRAVLRTDLFNYHRVNFDWRVGGWKGLSANGRVSLLKNRNPIPEIDLSGHSRNYSFAVNYEPSERIRVNLDYSRDNTFSDIAILLPQTLTGDRSVYDERLHGVGGSIGVGVYRGTRFDFGYRGILSSGDLPLNYHQPFASLQVPLNKRLAVRTHWQYYGYNEKAMSLQDYRSHLVTLSLALNY